MLSRTEAGPEEDFVDHGCVFRAARAEMLLEFVAVYTREEACSGVCILMWGAGCHTSGGSRNGCDREQLRDHGIPPMELCLPRSDHRLRSPRINLGTCSPTGSASRRRLGPLLETRACCITSPSPYPSPSGFPFPPLPHLHHHHHPSPNITTITTHHRRHGRRHGRGQHRPQRRR